MLLPLNLFVASIISLKALDTFSSDLVSVAEDTAEDTVSAAFSLPQPETNKPAVKAPTHNKVEINLRLELIIILLYKHNSIIIFYYTNL